MQTNRSQNMTVKFRVSLRLWSDAVPMAELLKQSGFEAEHCHRLGEMIVVDGRPTSRIARQHYAALQDIETSDLRALSIWLTATQNSLHSNDELFIALTSGKIDGIVWIAIFGDEIHPVPHFDTEIIGAYRDLGVKILVENYTDLDVDGIPRKTWLAP